MCCNPRGVVLVWGLLLGSAVVVDSAPVRAEEPRVTVYSVGGAGAKRVRRFLEQQIEKRYTLVAREAFLSASSELGISRHRTRRRSLKRIARKAGVDAVVTGVVYRSHRRWWLAIKVYDGGTGRIARQGVVRFPYFMLNKWARKAILKILTKGVAKARGVDHPRRVVVAPVRRRVPPRKHPTPTALGERPAYMTGLLVGVGVEMWARRLSFTNLEGEPGKQLLYETNSPIVPLFLDVEAYPGAFITRHRILSNIGLGFTFRRAVGVVSQREGETTEIKTTIQRVGGRLVYRWNVGRKVTSPEIKFSLGVEALEFSFGEDLGLVSGVLYLAFKPAIRARFPLATDRVSLGLFVGGLAVMQLGQMADAYHYGSAKAGGVEVGLELDVRLFWRVHLIVGAQTSWYFISFSQMGEQFLDYEFVADSAVDSYFGGYLLMAVHY